MASDYSDIKTEREILGDAWFIIKGHHSMNFLDRDSLEWAQINAQCQRLYYKSGTPAQQDLAKDIAHALMNYYGARYDDGLKEKMSGGKYGRK